MPSVVGLGFAVADNPYPVPRLSSASAAAGYLGTAALITIRNLSRDTPYSTLRRNRERLERTDQPLSSEERFRIHQDLLGARGALPKWVVGTPLLVGGVVAMLPAFDDYYYQAERNYAVIIGGVMLLSGSIALIGQGPVEAYETDLKTLQLSVAVRPAGIAASGTFSAL
jgi:hypothetical protein